MERRNSPGAGFTAIELLILIAVAAIILSFALPAARTSIHEAQLEQALKITRDSVRHARRTARIYNTEVLMQIESNRLQTADTITLTFPEMQRDPALARIREEFVLPEGVDITSGDMLIQFDAGGEVEWPTTVVIASQDRSGPSEYLKID